MRTPRTTSLSSRIVAAREMEARALYAAQEVVDIGADDFIQMLVLDGCFNIATGREEPSLHTTPFGPQQLSVDLILAENQIPFFVLVDLMAATKLPEFDATGYISPTRASREARAVLPFRQQGARHERGATSSRGHLPHAAPAPFIGHHGEDELGAASTRPGRTVARCWRRLGTWRVSDGVYIKYKKTLYKGERGNKEKKRKIQGPQGTK
ncbi:hypothetical protein BRADI_2g61330v3 [Brachypodium distachyon]|uniref:Uncharacterized protein n=1 Tax=Brachypodium distachyon TaxID=15368 RepID=I1HVD6_BRADI|nr:hypothetical protein BRADI_2g61330v3 [Brachypodium distachyon]